jgi:RNA polymerase sigma-70 factor (ECF subfamily)
MELADERRRIEAAQKDPGRFAELYEEHFDRVYAFVARRVRDRSAAQDLTAQVFHDALANLKKFEWRGVPFAAWLYRIASNAVTDHFHRQSREAAEQDVAVPESTTTELEQVEQRATLFRLVETLPVDQRLVIIMRFAEERPIREIAARIGRSEGAVKQLQWRGLQTLRARVGQSHA